jgi:hypothetical protein
MHFHQVYTLTYWRVLLLQFLNSYNLSCGLINDFPYASKWPSLPEPKFEINLQFSIFNSLISTSNNFQKKFAKKYMNQFFHYIPMYPFRTSSNAIFLMHALDIITFFDETKWAFMDNDA